MISKKDPEGELLFAMVMKLAGGEQVYSEHTKAAIWAECGRNTELRNQATMYLYGSSERADLNLYRIHTMLVEKFFSEVA
jgi:hypothetical protein